MCSKSCASRGTSCTCHPKWCDEVVKQHKNIIQQYKHNKIMQYNNVIYYNITQHYIMITTY